MSFDNFVQIAVTVKSLTDAFMRIDKEGRGYATIGYEQVTYYSALNSSFLNWLCLMFSVYFYTYTLFFFLFFS